MKKRITAAATFLMACLMLSGCQKAAYSSDDAKKIADEHYADAAAWFEVNRPEASVGKSCKAVKDGVDLYCLVEGSYTIGKETYRYIYDYIDDHMYTDEFYDETCAVVSRKTAELVGVSEDCIAFNYYGYGIPAVSANTAESAHTPGGEETKTNYMEMLPAEAEPETYGKAVVDGEVTFEYFLNAYVDEVPSYDPAFFEAHPNCSSVNYYLPVSEGYDGLYGVETRAEGKTELYCHFEKLSDGLYGGYFSAYNREFDRDQVVFTYTDEGDGAYTIEASANVDVLLFYEKEVALQTYRINDNKETVTSDVSSLYKTDCPGHPDRDLFGSKYVLTRKGLTGYRKYSFSNGIETYHFKIK